MTPLCFAVVGFVVCAYLNMYQMYCSNAKQKQHNDELETLEETVDYLNDSLDDSDKVIERREGRITFLEKEILSVKDKHRHELKVKDEQIFAAQTSRDNTLKRMKVFEQKAFNKELESCTHLLASVKQAVGKLAKDFIQKVEDDGQAFIEKAISDREYSQIQDFSVQRNSRPCEFINANNLDLRSNFDNWIEATSKKDN